VPADIEWRRMVLREGHSLMGQAIAGLAAQ
jgi:hypothetical protein